MPTRRSRSRASKIARVSPTKKRTKAAAPTPPSLLVFVHDVGRLRADGLDLTAVAQFAGVVCQFVSGAHVEVREIDDERSLLDACAELARDARTFDVVVSIGHSNDSGIQVARDRFADWEWYASLLKAFQPKRLLLVACQAGRWPAASTLFSRLRRLRRIFASPVNVSGALGAVMVSLVPYLLEVKAPRVGVVTAAQVALAAATGGQVRQWMRADAADPDGHLLDLVAVAVDPLVRKIPGALAGIFR
jgi:hypothetical protein